MPTDKYGINRLLYGLFGKRIAQRQDLYHSKYTTKKQKLE